MAIAARDLEPGPPAALWSLAFRPFFLATAVWGALALALWIVIFLTGGTLPSRFDPLTWHIHAMLFGFMLTAIPNWTGRPPVQGAGLIGLVMLWLLGRIVCLTSASLPLWVAAGIDLAFPVVLFAVAAREIVAARNWRNIMMPLPIGVLAMANLLMYLELAQFHVPAGLGWRLAVAAIIALVTAIGGRIIPAFTRNWLMKRQPASLPASRDWIDRIALATLHTGLLGWAFFPASRPIGMLLLLGAVLTALRLARWRGMATLREPLLTILHVGYGWIVIGAGLLGASLLSAAVPQTAAIHAFTAGAMGTMVLAVMTRVTRGHTGRPLEANHTTVVIYLLIVAAGVARVAAACLNDAAALLATSAVLWVASFGLFALSYGSMLLRPRADAR